VAVFFEQNLASIGTRAFAAIHVDKRAGDNAKAVVINEALYLHFRPDLQNSDPPPIHRIAERILDPSINLRQARNLAGAARNLLAHH
jgi:hypothetical protein